MKTVSYKAIAVVIWENPFRQFPSLRWQAKAQFDAMEMKRLWLAWTEDKIEGQKVKQELGRALRAVRQGLAKLQAAGSDAAGRVQGGVDFFGSLAAEREKTQAMLDYLKGRPGIKIKYHEPGTVFVLPEVPTVRVYVLGPPRNVAQWKITNPRKSKHEGYEDTSVTGDTEGFVSALLSTTGEADEERSFPFARVFRKSEAEVKAGSFLGFSQVLGFSNQDGEPWRRIDASWAGVDGKARNSAE